MIPLPVLDPSPQSFAGPPAGPSDRAAVAAELERLFPGQIHFDRHHRLLYATDASNYQIEPIGVAVPRSTDALARLVAWCGARRLPLLPRGGGTSLAGQCTNHALVLDHSRHCRRVLALDPAARTCHVEPGVGVDELNRWLAASRCGLFFAPDPATSAQVSVGGCVGNNAAGARSIRYGRTSENVAALDVILSGGERLWLGPGAGRKDARAGALAGRVAAVVARHAGLIRQRFPRTVRRNAGYGLDLILAQLDRGVGPDDLDLIGLICGSEGTLAVVLGAVLQLHPLPAARGLAIAAFESVEAAIAAVPAILATAPSAVELLDDVVLAAAAGNAECRGYLDLLPPDAAGRPPRAVLYVEYQSAGPAAGAGEIEASFDPLRRALAGVPLVAYRDQPALLRAWALRKAGEPLLHNLSARRKPVTLIEDNAIPVEHLARFVAGCKRIVARHGTSAAYYAHASVGVLHVRPMLDLHAEADRARMVSIAVEVADLARECGGVMSGEHGDGRVRGPLLGRFFGPELMGAFAEIKAVFDSAGVLNPGMIVHAGPVEGIARDLRVRPGGGDLRWPAVETFFDYSDQEGFAGALEMCNGAGVCRKTAGGTMCPSYRATLDERHATRGRANALRLAISGQLAGGSEAGGHGDGGGGRSSASRPAWADPGTIQTLSLCLSCKACKSECPSNVDVARLKAEYTAQRYRDEGRVPWRARLFGHVRALNRLGSQAPGLANGLMSLGPVRALFDYALGLDARRSLPPFGRSLYRWFASRRRQPAREGTGRERAAPEGAPRVVLYADCFTAYNEPNVGRAAVEVLEAFGYEVLLPRIGCCGRAMISTGLLADAIGAIDATLAALRPFVDDGRVAAIVVAEPSCLAAMKDEWLGLKLATPADLRRRCAAKAMLPEEFLEAHWDRHPTRPPGSARPADPAGPPVLWHGHCHQKALGGEQRGTALLTRLLGPRLRLLPSGCCGMAGSFGFTRDHYEVSMRIFEQSLGALLGEAPAGALLLAPGISCRHQARDGAGRAALHPVEWVRQWAGAAVVVGGRAYRGQDSPCPRHEEAAGWQTQLPRRSGASGTGGPPQV